MCSLNARSGRTIQATLLEGDGGLSDGWRGLCALGTLRVDVICGVLCSRNARLKTPLVRRAHLDPCGRHPLTHEEMECRLGVLLGKEGDIEAGLFQCQAKEFTFAGAVVDQEYGRVSRHR